MPDLCQYLAQDKLEAIKSHLLAADANVVIVATYCKATEYRRKHVAMFKVIGKSLYAQRGKSWDCIDGCAVRFGHYV
jgi:hypothetical protein